MNTLKIWWFYGPNKEKLGAYSEEKIKAMAFLVILQILTAGCWGMSIYENI